MTALVGAICLLAVTVAIFGLFICRALWGIAERMK